MGFFSRTNKKEDTQSHNATDNPTDRTYNLIRKIVKELSKDKDSRTGITIWAISDYYYSIVKTEKFEQELRAALDDAELVGLGSGKIEVRHAVPAENDNAVNVCDSEVFVSRITIKATSPDKRLTAIAKVSILEGTGSTEQPCYILDPDVKETYHIGRGKNVRRSNAFRRNDIVINDSDPNEQLAALNNHVSGSQADIIYCTSFYGLKAMRSGCRSEGGVPTKILRDNEVIELTDSHRIHQLNDGDMIELGKSVILEFNLAEKNL